MNALLRSLWKNRGSYYKVCMSHAILIKPWWVWRKSLKSNLPEIMQRCRFDCDWRKGSWRRQEVLFTAGKKLSFHFRSHTALLPCCHFLPGDSGASARCKEPNSRQLCGLYVFHCVCKLQTWSWARRVSVPAEGCVKYTKNPVYKLSRRYFQSRLRGWQKRFSWVQRSQVRQCYAY